MAWLAVAVWVVVVLLVLPAGAALLPSLGTLVMVSLAGLATVTVFAIDGAVAWAWISVGLAFFGLILATVGARTLSEDSAQILHGVKDSVKSVAALSVGLGLPFLAAAGLVTAAIAAA
jgi:hypothetical protein